MDLLAYLHFHQTAEDRDTFLLSSSQRSMASPPSSQTQFLSSQGLSGSQGLPSRWRSPPEDERPASCGQPEGNENARPSFAAQSGPVQQQATSEDVSGELSNFQPLQLQDIKDFDKLNPPKERLVPARVPKSTGEWKTQLQHHCDQFGVRPVVTYEEVSNQSFIAKLDVAGQVFVTKIPQPSKKHAQEEACKLALAEMPPLDKMEGMDGAGKRGKKRKSGDDVGEALPKRDESENWVGVLNIYFQRNKYPALRFDDGRTEKDPPRFSAGVTVPERPDEPFTSGTATFSTKKDAQATAAKAAVLWLREQGKLEDAQDKRQKCSTSGGSEDVSMTSEPSKSVAQEVHELAVALGFQQPEWKTAPSTGSSGQGIEGTGSFIDMAAYFRDCDTVFEPRIQGPIGEVKHCFGRTQAKKACAERVLSVLLEIKRSRLASV